MRGRYSIAVLALGCVVFPLNLFAQTDWPSFGNDPGATRYSPLKQINTGNVSQLKVAWTFDGTLEEAPPPGAPRARCEPCRCRQRRATECQGFPDSSRAAVCPIE